MTKEETPKKSAFDRATEASGPEVMDNEEAERSYVPRAVFTQESGLDMSKLQIGLLRIAQGMTAEVKERKAAVGQFVLTNFQAKDKVVLVPFGATEFRLLKPDPKQPVMCSAPTGDFGYGDPGGACVDEFGKPLCPMAKWGEKNPITGRSTPPQCKDGVMMRAYSITHKCLVDYQFLGGERSKGSFIQQQGISFGWSNFAVEFTSTNKSNAKGDWFIPQMEMLDQVPELDREVIAKWYEVFCLGLATSKQEVLMQLNAGPNN